VTNSRKKPKVNAFSTRFVDQPSNPVAVHMTGPNWGCDSSALAEVLVKKRK
jgi:hypothetical protein